MISTSLSLDSFEPAGGHPVLDFINTVRFWPPGPGDELLHGFDDVIEWHRRQGLITADAAHRLRRAEPEAASDAHHQTLALRATLHRLFLTVARQQPLPQDTLDALTATVQRTIVWRRLMAEEGRLCCGWHCSEEAPESILGPIAWKAMELLENGPLDRLKECPPPDGCGWLFLDRSKNRSRHWCSMKTCGNTAKVRRFRQRRADDTRA